MQTFTVPPAVDSIGYQLMCFFIYSFLAWFAYNVSPSEKGNPIWFLFTKSYWGIESPSTEIDSPPSFDSLEEEDVRNEAKNAYDPEYPAKLRLLNLQKTYKKYFCIPTKKAVEGLSLALPEGQVFALLGHNGAGKTTSINILTGLLKPSGGRSFVIYNLEVMQLFIQNLLEIHWELFKI